MKTFKHCIPVFVLSGTVAFFGFSASTVKGQFSGSGPSVGEIEHLTDSQAYGLDRTRNTIGIGEPVTCQIDTNSWSDIYWEYDPETGAYDIGPFYDGIGNMTWSCDNPYVFMFPTYGDESSFIADHTSSAHDMTVYCVLDDTGTYNHGAPKSLLKQVKFTVLPPSGVGEVYVVADRPYGLVETQAPVSFGARTKFLIQVLPNSVDFVIGGNLTREVIAPVPAHTFPDGHSTNPIAEIQSIGIYLSNGEVEAFDGTGNEITVHALNYFYDDVDDTVRWKESHLKDKNTGQYVNDSLNVNQSLQYWAYFADPDYGGWQEYSWGTHTHKWNSNFGGTKAGSAQSIWRFTGGGLQGPYDLPATDPF